jgi:hypothetical protein
VKCANSAFAAAGENAMKKDFKKIAAKRAAVAVKTAAVHSRIDEVHAQMLATEPGSPEEAVLAEKMARLIFMGKEDALPCRATDARKQPSRSQRRRLTKCSRQRT